MDSLASDNLARKNDSLVQLNGRPNHHDHHRTLPPLDRNITQRKAMIITDRRFPIYFSFLLLDIKLSVGIVGIIMELSRTWPTWRKIVGDAAALLSTQRGQRGEKQD